MRLAPLILALLALPALAGQVYQWKDAEGNVHFTDQPPPAGVKNSSQKDYRSSQPSGGSYSGNSQPKTSVTLYATATCGVHCDRAKAHLARRGISYTSKDPSTSIDASEELKKGGATPRVPTLFIGSEKLEGYTERAWDAALDKAGYPAAKTENP